MSQVEEDRDELELCYIDETTEKEVTGMMRAISPEVRKRKNNLQ